MFETKDILPFVKMGWPFIPSIATYCVGHYNGKAKGCVSEAITIAEEIRDAACNFWCTPAEEIPSTELMLQCHKIQRLINNLSHKLNNLSKTSIFFCGTSKHVLKRIRDIRQTITGDNFTAPTRAADRQRADLIDKKILHLQTAIADSYQPIPVKKLIRLIKGLQ